MIKNYLRKIIWFTGLSGVGKTTLSNSLSEELKRKKFKIMKIDGDLFRKKNRMIEKFTKKHIIKNNTNIINYAKKKQSFYDFILISAISPLAITRRLAKKTFNKKYFEVYVFCKIKTLINRDTKGLYKKAIKKKINNLIGFR